MDEEIIKRLVYIVLGIIFFFVVFKKKNKKTVKESATPQKANQHPYSKPPVKKNEPYFPPVETIKKEEYKSTNLEKTIIESENASLEMIEDEVTSNHKSIKKKNINTAILHEDKQEKFSVSEEDWKKAIILSDIITPKYF